MRIRPRHPCTHHLGIIGTLSVASFVAMLGCEARSEKAKAISDAQRAVCAASDGHWTSPRLSPHRPLLRSWPAGRSKSTAALNLIPHACCHHPCVTVSLPLSAVGPRVGRTISTFAPLDGLCSVPCTSPLPVAPCTRPVPSSALTWQRSGGGPRRGRGRGPCRKCRWPCKKRRSA